jgi:hypothetical protein
MNKLSLFLAAFLAFLVVADALNPDQPHQGRKTGVRPSAPTLKEALRADHTFQQNNRPKEGATKALAARHLEEKRRRGMTAEI